MRCREILQKWNKIWMWLACRITAVTHLITVKLQVKFKKFRKLSCGKQKCQTLVQVTIYRWLRIGRDGHFDQSELYENTANRSAKGGLVVRVRVVSDGIIKNHSLRWVMTRSVTNHYTMAVDSKPNDLVLIVWNPLPEKVWSRMVYDQTPVKRRASVCDAGPTFHQRLLWFCLSLITRRFGQLSRCRRHHQTA